MITAPLPQYYALMMVGTVFAILLAATGVLVALVFLDSSKGQQMIRRRLARRVARARLYGKLERRDVSPHVPTEITPPAGMRIHVRTGKVARDASSATTRRRASKPTTGGSGTQGRSDPRSADRVSPHGPASG